MNIWGGDVTVERCKRMNIHGANLPLKKDAKAKIVDWELDWGKVEIDPKFTGRFDRAATITKPSKQLCSTDAFC
jgi:hypothetical protein